MASMKKRAYLLTFNNPAEHGMTHEAIKEILAKKFKLRYYSMAEELLSQDQSHQPYNNNGA